MNRARATAQIGAEGGERRAEEDAERHRRHVSWRAETALASCWRSRHPEKRVPRSRGDRASWRGLSRAVVIDRADLGFVDLLAHEGLLDTRSRVRVKKLFWRRSGSWRTASLRKPAAAGADAAPWSRATVGLEIELTWSDPIRPGWRKCSRRPAWAPHGKPVGTGRAGGFETCAAFAQAAAMGRASLKQCVPYQARRVEEAQRDAAVDTLTGLAAYKVLHDRLSYEVERSKRSLEGFAVLFIDLDHFKLVNDQYGHEAGNAVLRAVATELKSAIRASDLAARYGGDEFVVLLTGPTWREPIGSARRSGRGSKEWDAGWATRSDW